MTAPALTVEEPVASTSASTLPPTSASASAEGETPAPNPPLSKNAQKRLAKQAALEALKPARRARERARLKEKKVEKRKLVEMGVIERPAKKSKPGSRPFGARVVVDLGFDALMNDKEIKSMTSQIGYCYSVNRSSPSPINLMFTSLGGKLKDRMDSKQSAYTAWKNVEWWSEPYQDLWNHAVDPVSGEGEPPKITIGASEGKPRSTSLKEDVVYLTGDSPNVLETLEEGKTYVIGGIVDHNRYKNLCFEKAEKDGVAHAQLPISQYLPEMLTRKVLTVNQVVDIIVKWTELRDWTAALRAVMPTRKFEADGKRSRRGDGSVVGGEDDEGSEDQEEYSYVAHEGDEEAEPTVEAGGAQAEMAETGRQATP